MPTNTGPFSKKWEDLTFSDNFIFCKVMENEKICRQMIEILLDIKVEKIEYIDTEHTEDPFYETRGIRLDVYVKGTTEVYDVEMQNADYADLPLRARYYQSASDISTTPRRTKFKELKKTYIIFICKNDPFGAQLPLYTVKSIIHQAPQISYNDKTHKIFYNSSAWNKVENRELRAVLKYIYENIPTTDFTQNIEENVEIAKAKPVFKDDYMYFCDIVEDEKEKARDEALVEGRKEGLAEGAKNATIENARKLKAKNIDLNIIAECTGLTEKEVANL